MRWPLRTVLVAQDGDALAVGVLLSGTGARSVLTPTSPPTARIPRSTSRVTAVVTWRPVTALSLRLRAHAHAALAVAGAQPAGRGAGRPRGRGRRATRRRGRTGPRRRWSPRRGGRPAAACPSWSPARRGGPGEEAARPSPGSSADGPGRDDRHLRA